METHLITELIAGFGQKSYSESTPNKDDKLFKHL